MVPTELRPNLSTLHEALGNGPNVAWREAATGAYPGEWKRWYLQALSSVIVLLGDEPIAFLNVRGDLTDAGYTAQAEVFTDGLVVSATCEGSGDAEPQWQVGATSLDGLREVSVTAGGLAFATNIDAEWPGVVGAELTFEGGAVVPLVPAGRNSEHRKTLAAFVRVMTARLS